MRHAPAERLDRHCHEHGFLSLVLEGGYVEAGDEGRRRIGPGDVLVHRALESHVDCFQPRGASVLILPLPARLGDTPVAGRCMDPDAIVRLAERDAALSARRLMKTLQPIDRHEDDWPDRLAAKLRSLETFLLGDWADAMGLRLETVSRGFRQAYGTTPKAFRATARARAAHAAVRRGQAPLADIAAELGFADQAHMTRAVTALTGAPPSTWLREGGQAGIHTAKKLSCDGRFA